MRPVEHFDRYYCTKFVLNGIFMLVCNVTIKSGTCNVKQMLKAKPSTELIKGCIRK